MLEIVMDWAKVDEAAREQELGQLLPLVRFPMMMDGARALTAEPLVAQHALAAWLASETDPQCDASTQVEGCPRPRPRVIPLCA